MDSGKEFEYNNDFLMKWVDSPSPLHKTEYRFLTHYYWHLNYRQLCELNQNFSSLASKRYSLWIENHTYPKWIERALILMNGMYANSFQISKVK